MSLIVRGATLAGLAAAARLARLGHEVVLVTGATPLGERWADGALPPAISLPAAWRDLFKKTGSHLVPVLNRHGLEMVPAPPTLHRLPSGRELLLPHDRGGQHAAITHTLGADAASRWRELLDGLDREWASFRSHTMESAAPPGDVPRSQPWLAETVSDLARRLDGELAVLVAHSAASTRAPAVEAFRWTVERTFGLWHLVDADGQVQAGGRLIALLVDRLHELGVVIVEEAPGTDIDCRPRPGAAPRWRGPLHPARAPRVRTETSADLHADVARIVEHTPRGVVCTWPRRTGEGTVSTVHDHTVTTPDTSWGLAPRSGREWRHRPGIVDKDLLRASTCSPAGAEPWAELSSAALAVYELHLRTTGEDCSPHNPAFTMPRLAERSHPTEHR